MFEDVLIKGIEKIFIIHDMYAYELAEKTKKGIKERINNENRSAIS